MQSKQTVIGQAAKGSKRKESESARRSDLGLYEAGGGNEEGVKGKNTPEEVTGTEGVGEKRGNLTLADWSYWDADLEMRSGLSDGLVIC